MTVKKTEAVLNVPFACGEEARRGMSSPRGRGKKVLWRRGRIYASSTIGSF